MSSTPSPTRPRSGAAVGFTFFASIVLMIAGFNQVMMGLIAVINDTFYVRGEEYIFQFDVTTWGWVHMLIGAVLALAGFGLFAGAIWARTIGVIIASVSVVANFLWLPYYPIWSLVLIALAIAVIWALTIHGRDITA